ncbi:MAG TPA: hypothetical protein QF887_03695, partial [SAR324 cluster bacterium]|nr:hypothetical protein [SAR324 cluster bacterium]
MANAPATQPETEIRQAQREDAETVFELIRALAHFHGDQADFRATLQDVLRMDSVKLQFTNHGCWKLRVRHRD